MTRVVEKAHANKVKLPENFFLGFDEFAARFRAMKQRVRLDNSSRKRKRSQIS